MRYALLIFILALTAAVAGHANDAGDRATLPGGSASGEPAETSPCAQKPADAQQVNYTIFSSNSTTIASSQPAIPPQQTGPQPVARVYDGQEMQSEAEYAKVFGASPSNIDWTTSRLLVIELTSTYRLGQLDSRVTLAEISETANALYVGLTLSHLGPCQGTAQLPQWFSTVVTDLFVLVPTGPAHIAQYTCVVGGCPEGIP